MGTVPSFAFFNSVLLICQPTRLLQKDYEQALIQPIIYAYQTQQFELLISKKGKKLIRIFYSSNLIILNGTLIIA